MWKFENLKMFAAWRLKKRGQKRISPKANKFRQSAVKKRGSRRQKKKKEKKGSKNSCPPVGGNKILFAESEQKKKGAKIYPEQIGKKMSPNGEIVRQSAVKKEKKGAKKTRLAACSSFKKKFLILVN